MKNADSFSYDLENKVDRPKIIAVSDVSGF